MVQPLPSAIASGNDQIDDTGATLPQPLVVTVTAADGLGVEGVEVVFGVAAGNGSLSATSVSTDAEGMAQVIWTLGSVPSAMQATATVPAANNASVTFIATAQVLVFRWLNTGGGNWSDPTNWDLGLVPSVGSTVIIDLDGIYTVNLDVVADVGVLTLGAATGTQTLSIAANTLTLNMASTVGAKGVIDMSGGTLNGVRLTVGGILTAGLGATVTLDTLEIGGVLTVLGTYTVTNTVLTGSGPQIIPLAVSLNNAEVTGTAQLDNPFGTQTISGNLVIAGNGILNFNNTALTVGADFTTRDNGVIVLASSLDVLRVTGNIMFGGGGNTGPGSLLCPVLGWADSYTKCNNVLDGKGDLGYGSLQFSTKRRKATMMYRQITFEGRYSIALLRRQEWPPAAIARALGRHRSTIVRELRRHGTRHDGWYRPQLADWYARGRRSRSRLNQRFSPAERRQVGRLLERQWSPEQVAGYLRRHRRLRISHETIYRYIWADKQQGGTLYTHLRGARKQRHKRYGAYDSRRRLAGKRPITARPTMVAARTQVGHWEVDTMLGAGQAGPCVLTVVERKTGYVAIGKLPARTTTHVTRRATQLIRRQPRPVRTVTADNGTEFHDYATIEQRTGARFYFATPHHEWERGTNENTNGLIRQYLPKGESMQHLTQQDCNAIARHLHRRPRKRLGFRTPEECYEP